MHTSASHNDMRFEWNVKSVCNLFMSRVWALTNSVSSWWKDKKGLADNLEISCSNRHIVLGASYTSGTMPGENGAFEVTKTVTASHVCGFGAVKLNKFCEYLNIPRLSSETFQTHSEATHQQTPQLKAQLSELAVQALQEAHIAINPDSVLGDNTINIGLCMLQWYMAHWGPLIKNWDYLHYWYSLWHLCIVSCHV